jgi:hypothetical protein
MEQLIKKYSPIVYINSEEKYLPSSIDWMLKYSTLVDFNTNTKIKSPSQRDLYEIAKKYDFQRRGEGDVVLSFDSDVYKGQTPLSDVPVYAFSRETEDKIYITYMILLPYNGSYDIAGLAELGEHPGDLEYMTIECSKDGNLKRVYFGAHGYKDGRWVDGSLVELENDHIVCYMAFSGHGLYHKPGQVFRFGGFANDVVNRGIRWTPNVSTIYYRDDPKFNIDTMGWTTFNSRIGGGQDKPNTDGIMGLPDKPWFVNGTNPDETYYNPPPIISGKASKGYSIIVEFLKIAMIYISILLLRYILGKFVFNKYLSSDSIKDNILQSIIIISILLVLHSTLLKAGNYIILNYIPV